MFEIEDTSRLSAHSDPTLNDLPCELLPLIFSFLDIKQLFICGRVCKKFYYFVDKVQLRHLAITSDKNKKLSLNWFYDNVKINENFFAIGIGLPNFLKNYRFDLTRLNRLCIIESEPLSKQIIENLLNQMRNLTNLELTINRNDLTAGQVILNLPELRTFKLFCLNDKYTINSSKLEAVQLYLRPNYIKFSNLESIRYLKIKCLIYSERYDVDLPKLNANHFPNIEKLHICYLESRNFEFFQTLINDLKKLNEIHFNASPFIKKTSQTIRYEFERIIREYRHSLNTNLQVFLEGLSILK